MNFNIKKPSVNISDVFSSAPGRWWSKLIAFSVLLLIIVFVFDWWVYSVNLNGNSAKNYSDDDVLQTLKKDSFRKVFQRINEKKSAFDANGAGFETNP
ncbi:hypothetical protein HYW53_03620 [Candidatus Giovannonibacteria bacterium]|nr:hypothetical protein [Candidatus Giovannonibacteria bacterium]